jgi:twitching motility protein PilT
MQIEDILKLCITEQASDLHIMPGMQPLLRIHGDLKPAQDFYALSAETAKRLIYSVLAIEQQHEFEKNLVMEVALSFPHIGNFRLSVLHQLRGIAAVFRVIPENIPTFDELLLPLVMKRLLALAHGLIMITGPTGSGKSTTLASMVDYINSSRACHIITIEDPIEFIHQSKMSAINQIQIGRDSPNVATSLRAALRQDPDVIMLGEMRDLESIRLALTAAETGHLVLATMHANTAPLAISRIIDIFPTAEKNRVRNMLAETTQAVICQTLVKKMTGGRVAAFEIMLANPAIRHLISQDMISHMESTIQTSGDIGMCTLEQYLQTLVAKRIISTAVARGVALNWGQFKKE